MKTLNDALNKKKRLTDKEVEEQTKGGINITGRVKKKKKPTVTNPYYSMPRTFKEKESEGMNKYDKNTLIAGATPLLVGLLTGSTGDALDVSIDGMAAQEKIRREDSKSLMSYLQKRTDANNKESKGRLYQVKNADGSISYKSRKDAVNNDAPDRRRSINDSSIIAQDKSNIRKEEYTSLGKQFVKGKNEITDADTLINRIDQTEVDVKSDVNYPVNGNQQKIVDKSVEKYNADVFKSDENINMMEKASKDIGVGQLGSKLAVMGLIKQVETRLSDEDRRYYASNLSLIRAIKERISSEKSGVLPPRLIAEAKELIVSSLASARKFKSGIRSSRIEQLRNRGIDSDYLEKRFGSQPVSKEPNAELKSIEDEMKELEASGLL